MNLIDIVKGVIRRMIGSKTVESVLHITPLVSTEMKTAIELWEDMYKDKSPWLTENVKSLGLPALIASEKARTATIEMQIKVTGDSDRAKFIKSSFDKILVDIREQLEYGIALGGFVIKPYLVLGPKGKYIIEFDYTKASDFFPLAFSPEGKVTEAAFVDRIITKDKVYSKVEYHKLVSNTLEIHNMAFECSNTQLNIRETTSSELGNPIPLTSVPAWASITPDVVINDVDTMLFAYFKMPEANTVDLNSPLGASGYSRAISLIEEADKLYSDLLWEFEGGQLAVDVDRTALNPMKDSKGREIEVLPKLQDRLFRRNLDLGEDDTYNVFSPALRDKSIINGLNNQLMRIEDACFLSRGTLSIVSTSEARTATELKILKQRSYAANQDIQKALQGVFEEVTKIVDIYCDLYEIVSSGSYEISYHWDDSIIVDKDAERQVDLLDVNAGLLSKVEYRMKWMGETRVQAEEALKLIEEEKRKQLELENMFTPQHETRTPANTDAQQQQNELKRSNESVEVTKKLSSN